MSKSTSKPNQSRWQPPPGWIPLEKTSITRESQKTIRTALIKKYRENPAFREALPAGTTLEDLLVGLRQEFAKASDNIWLNDLYQVVVKQVEMPAGDGWHLSIKRLDKAPITDWRHKQWIKNQLLGPEVEAVELYPAESRVVDSANQYHLWAFKDPGFRFPLGFPAGFKMEGTLGSSQQRGFGEA